MPIVTIQITREGTTSEQKAALIKGATDLLVDVLNKPPGLRAIHFFTIPSLVNSR
jgi:4-oxalocrotonate tautomerase